MVSTRHEWLLAHQPQIDAFHAHLIELGYEVPRDSQALLALFDFYRSGEWGEMVQTDFAPVWVWNAKAKAMLAPFAKVRMESHPVAMYLWNEEL